MQYLFTDQQTDRASCSKHKSACYITENNSVAEYKHKRKLWKNMIPLAAQIQHQTDWFAERKKSSSNAGFQGAFVNNNRV